MKKTFITPEINSMNFSPINPIMASNELAPKNGNVKHGALTDNRESIPNEYSIWKGKDWIKQ